MLNSRGTNVAISVQEQVPLDGPCFQRWQFADGSTWLEFHRCASGYRLRFPALADFTVSQDGSQIQAFPAPSTSAATVEHLYLNQVLPLALSRQHKLVFHASAVELGNRALAFFGPSGYGKSTLAASFSTNGYRFLTDDGLQLTQVGDQFMVNPSHPSIRLWDDSKAALIPNTVATAPELEYTPKARLLADAAMAHCTEERPLQLVYVLDAKPADSVIFTPMAPGERVLALLTHCFLLDMEERAMLAEQFSQLTAMARSVSFFRLAYPRDYQSLS